MQIDRRLLDATHDAFLKWLDDDGEKFTSFWTCRRLREEEVLYKRRTHESARDALHLRDWSRLQPGEGKILARLQEAMRRDENLLQRVIERGWTESTAVAAFFHPGERLPEVERLVWELFEADVADPGGSSTPCATTCAASRASGVSGHRWDICCFCSTIPVSTSCPSTPDSSRSCCASTA